MIIVLLQVWIVSCLFPKKQERMLLDLPYPDDASLNTNLALVEYLAVRNIDVRAMNRSNLNSRQRERLVAIVNQKGAEEAANPVQEQKRHALTGFKPPGSALPVAGGAGKNTDQDLVKFLRLRGYRSLGLIRRSYLVKLAQRALQQEAVLDKHAANIPTTSMPPLVNFCSTERVGAYYINLQHRVDRNAKVHRELRKVFPPSLIHRVEGFQDIGWGANGCRKSHIRALNRALLDNVSHAFIFEDDFAWKWSRQKVCAQLQSVLNYKTWNMVLLAASCTEPREHITPFLDYYQGKCILTTAYLIKREYIPTLIKLWSDETKHPIDVSWGVLQTQEHKFYVASPMLGHQEPSYSDIEGKLTVWKQTE
jgi:GR25 family glycosyltransferase involved in LPS biosynthesis